MKTSRTWVSSRKRIRSARHLNRNGSSDKERRRGAMMAKMTDDPVSLSTLEAVRRCNEGFDRHDVRYLPVPIPPSETTGPHPESRSASAPPSQFPSSFRKHSPFSPARGGSFTTSESHIIL